jgi:hypothetical protein
MPETTDGLLSANVQPPRVREQSPFEILDAVGRAIAQQSGGLLVGDIRTRRDDNATMHRLALVVPALGGGMQGVLTAIQPNDDDYPAWIHAACFPRSLSVPPYTLLTPAEDKEFVASGPEQFRRLVEKVMRSASVVADVEWLTARTKEALSQQNGAAEGAGP